MGTNYYLHQSEQKVCPTCGHDSTPEPLHIGKSSAGWCFSLHVIPEKGINDLPDWERLWSQPGARIVDEYGVQHDAKEMRERITERSRPVRGDDDALWDHWSNGSVPGPNGLVRHRIGPHCVGHGAGTWDLIPGEFS